MRPFPFTKVCGAVSAASGALAAFAVANKLNTLAMWCGGTFVASSALAQFMSRNHATTDEQAVGITQTDANRAATGNQPPNVKTNYYPSK
jgi:hypothetical protein